MWVCAVFQLKMMVLCIIPGLAERWRTVMLLCSVRLDE
jgi:hypothetical protein